MSKFVKLYIVDVEKSTYDRLESLFYSKPELGVKVHGYAHNFVSCINDMPRAKDAEVFLISAFLPDQMGIDLIPKIKDKNPNAKVIVMLQNNTRNLAEPSKEKGADEILQKPYKIKSVKAKKNNAEMEQIDGNITGFRFIYKQQKDAQFTGQCLKFQKLQVKINKTEHCLQIHKYQKQYYGIPCKIKSYGHKYI